MDSVLISLVKYYEGLRLTPYRDPVGLWTVGYGHLCTLDRQAPQPPRISLEEADRLLASDLAQTANFVVRASNGLLDPYTLGALVDFTFNLGSGRLKVSTLLRKVKARASKDELVHELMKWRYGGGKELEGLARRRAADSYYLLTGGFDPAVAADWKQFLS